MGSVFLREVRSGIRSWMRMDQSDPSDEAGCLSGLAGLSIEIQKYENFFQIICSIIIPAYKP